MQIFKRILILAVIPSVLLTTIFGIVFANRAAAIFDPQKTTVAEAAYSYQAYVALTTENRIADDYVCGKMWTGTIDNADVTTFKWFQGGKEKTEVRLGMLLVPTGAVQYGTRGTGCNANSWLAKALALWGWGGDYGQFLDDTLYEPRGGGQAPSYANVTSRGDEARVIKNAIKTKYYSGNDPDMTDAIKYWIYLQNFQIGCGGSTETPPGDYTNADSNNRNKADTDDNTNHFWTVVDENGTVQDTIWKTTLGRGKNITTGYGVLPKASDFEANCGRLAELLRNKALAEAFSREMEKNAENKKSIAAVMASAGQNGGGTTNSCGIKDIEGPLAWFVCPISGGLAKFAQFMGNRIGDLLYTSPKTIFTPEFKKAWSTFRNIGLALVIIAGLVMVISQAFGLEILDAYTIRKLMPRIAIVMIGMALSWPLLQIAITFFNDLGLWANKIILEPFNGLGYPEGVGNSGMINSVLELTLIGAGGTALFIGAVLLGWAGILSLLFTVVLALLVGLLVLGVRQVVIMACILLAPLAIASYVLPGTQKLWGFWKNTLITTLAMFPIIMAFLASGEALSRMAAQASRGAGIAGSDTLNLLALLVFFAPYFMLPFAFKLAGGLMSTIFSLANDKSRGLFDRAKKFRQETMAYRKGEFAAGNKKGPNLAVGYARRSVLAKQGGFTPGRANQAQYRMAARKLAQDSARERAEKDHGSSLGDTDETRAAIHANSRKDYLNDMTQKYKDNAAAQGQRLSNSEAERMAYDSMARLEAGTQSEMGTGGMKLAAMRGQTTLDGAGWWKDGKFDHEGYGKAAKHMMDEGLMRAEDLGAMMAENAQRGDMNMGTFSERVNYNKAIQEGGLWGEDAAGNKVFERLSPDELAKRGRASMYRGIKSSQAITANLRTAEETSQVGVDRIQAALTGDTATVGTKNMNGGDVLLGAGAGTMDSVAAEFAQYGNYQEMMGYASGTNREEFSKKLMSTPVGELKGEAAVAFADMKAHYAAEGKQMTHQDMLEALRGNSGGLLDHKYVQMYTARHRELSARAVEGSGGRFNPPETTPTGAI